MSNPDERAWCDLDDGTPRGCCGTPRLGPHRDDCCRPASQQDAMRAHEEAWRHLIEASAPA